MRANAMVLMIASLVALLALAGCVDTPAAAGSGSGKSAADLERENRAKSESIVKLEDDLASARAERDRARKDLAAARKTPGAEGFHFEAAKVEFGFLTAAVNLDEKGKTTEHRFDNGIAAYVGLYDQFDSSLKVAGAFRFDLLDLARSSDFVLQTWTYEPEAAAKHWQRFPSCYQFKLPLSSDVKSRKAVLKVMFTRPGKPDLTATQELTIDKP
jgi:hypothetical protein